MHQFKPHDINHNAETSKMKFTADQEDANPQKQHTLLSVAFCI